MGFRSLLILYLVATLGSVSGFLIMMSVMKFQDYMTQRRKKDNVAQRRRKG